MKIRTITTRAQILACDINCDGPERASHWQEIWLDHHTLQVLV